jgi:uncharacterized membrane protein YgdD (TMEM256/DUF423 family)
MMLVRLAALSAALAIGAGAFGAHAAQGPAADWLRTGAMYQLIHAVAAIAVRQISERAAGLMLAGAAVFALTLYAMAFGAPRILGAVTPIGGLAMIAAWVLVAVRAR